MGASKEKALKAVEELRKNHNWSWAREIDFRNKDNLKGKTCFYRGTEFNYETFKQKSDEFAKSLVALGFKKGDEIPICMSNVPEFLFLLRAISVIGAKAHIFSEEFDKDYIKEIVASTKSSIVFITDNRYQELKEVISDKEIVMFSLADSLPNGEDPYIEYDYGFYDFANKVNMYKILNHSIMNLAEFVKLGEGIAKVDYADVGLDDTFIITYTSGSTNTTRPKAIKHANRSLIYMGRFHDPDLSGLPATRHIRVLAHIPTHSNTDIITSISDSLMQNCEIAFEPIYNPNFFIYSLMINEPHFAPATRSFYVQMSKMYNNMPEFQGVTFKNTYIPTVVGEPKSPGEEKYINKTLRKAKAGVAKIPRPLAPVPVSFGGGDCEHGGLYFTLWDKYLRVLNKISKNEEIGLIPFNGLIETVCLDSEGNLLGPNEYGILAADSPCTMQEYVNNEEATEAFYVTDKNGNKRANLNVYGYYDNAGTVHMKGRVGANVLTENYEMPLFMIKDVIEKDTKNILSCEVVITEGLAVAHIEPMPGINLSLKKLEGVVRRIVNELPCELLDVLLFKIRSNEESFPLTGCGKRSNPALSEEGLTADLIKAELYQDEITLSLPYSKQLVRKKAEML